MIFSILITIFIFFFLFAITERRVTPFFLTFAWVSLINLGYWGLADKVGNYSIAQIYTSSLACLSIGYAIVIKLNKDIFHGDLKDSIMNYSISSVVLALRIIGFIFLLLAIYHYGVAGIPVLSENVELDRYSFMKSGLYGLPGRVIIFAIPIYFIYSFGFRQLAKSAHKPVLKRSIFLAFMLLFATKVLTGFKGSILEIIVILFFTTAAVKRKFDLKQVLKKFSIPVFAALSYSIFISKFYFSILNKYSSGFEYIISRITLIAAMPGFRVMQGDISIPSGHSLTIVNDLLYYLPKYLGLSVEQNSYPFGKIVSASIHGRTLGSDAFIVPVTTGAFPALYFDFNIFALVVYVSLGALYGYFEISARRMQSPWKFTSSVVGMIALHNYITRGDLVYNAMNWAIMIIFVAALFFSFEKLFKRSSMTKYRSALGAKIF